VAGVAVYSAVNRADGRDAWHHDEVNARWSQFMISIYSFELPGTLKVTTLNMK